MTIDRTEPDAPVAVCDQCGERRYLDLEPDADDKQIADALKALGWRQETPARVKFAGGSSYGFQTLTYPQDFCADCRSDEERPHPIFRPQHARPRGPVDAFANDPCDAWPRALIWKAAGLNPMCGHPGTGIPTCSFCAAGYPLGHTRQLGR